MYFQAAATVKSSNFVIVSKQCPYDGDFKCNDTGVCLRSTDVCDGYSECQRRFGSDSDYDEQDCGMYMYVVDQCVEITARLIIHKLKSTISIDAYYTICMVVSYSRGLEMM